MGKRKILIIPEKDLVEGKFEEIQRKTRLLAGCEN
jgi:hypothetical protein